ncbi:MAG: peptidylprolyl isomerase, partial [Methylococcaceae bacterium]|nr:peptidylprolyl isomerase [Methylococcaceae bacterium]
TLTNDEGEVIDTSEGDEALAYLHGYGNIISGLESALTGKSVGDKFKVRIDAEDAYGEIEDDRVQIVSIEMFEGVDELEVGMQFHADVSSGPGVITIINIDGDDITIDGNHPLAGVPLTFDVEVVDIRPATDEEISHGHIHGAGGHHH